MTEPIARRQFLKVSGLAVAGALTMSCNQQKESAPAASSGNQQPSSPYASKYPRLLPGCTAYSYSTYLSKGKMTMEEFLQKAVEVKTVGVDITTYWLKSTDSAYLVSLRHLAFKNGLPLSGIGAHSEMCQPDASKRADQVKQIKKWVDVAEILGAPHVRVFGGELPKGATTAQGIGWVAETMKPACDYSGKKGITLGIEDHGGITGKADTILEIIHRIDSPYVGVNLDISNFDASSTEEQYRQIEACVPYATHTHIRDHFSNSHEPIDMDRVWRLFAADGYKGYMSSEYEGKEDAMTAVPKLMDQIETLCRKYSTV